MEKTTYRKYSKQDQKRMARWAADCAERVLPFFESEYPADGRPRDAIKACRAWAETGIFKMAEIRAASLGSHAAARQAVKDSPACFAARAAGQAVGTAHVAQHAYGSALYALKAIAAADPEKSETNLAKEWQWQARHLPNHLRRNIMDRLLIQKSGRGVAVKLIKSNGF
jgi:hypothetical protein